VFLQRPRQVAVAVMGQLLGLLMAAPIPLLQHCPCLGDLHWLVQPCHAAAVPVLRPRPLPAIPPLPLLILPEGMALCLWAPQTAVGRVPLPHPSCSRLTLEPPMGAPHPRTTAALAAPSTAWPAPADHVAVVECGGGCEVGRQGCTQSSELEGSSRLGLKWLLLAVKGADVWHLHPQRRV
jgi:hypothetical protein